MEDIKYKKIQSLIQYAREEFMIHHEAPLSLAQLRYLIEFVIDEMSSEFKIPQYKVSGFRGKKTLKSIGERIASIKSNSYKTISNHDYMDFANYLEDLRYAYKDLSDFIHYSKYFDFLCVATKNQKQQIANTVIRSAATSFALIKRDYKFNHQYITLTSIAPTISDEGIKEAVDEANEEAEKYKVLSLEQEENILNLRESLVSLQKQNSTLSADKTLAREELEFAQRKNAEQRAFFLLKQKEIETEFEKNNELEMGKHKKEIEALKLKLGASSESETQKLLLKQEKLHKVKMKELERDFNSRLSVNKEKLDEVSSKNIKLGEENRLLLNEKDNSEEIATITMLIKNQNEKHALLNKYKKEADTLKNNLSDLYTKYSEAKVANSISEEQKNKKINDLKLEVERVKKIKTSYSDMLNEVKKTWKDIFRKNINKNAFKVMALDDTSRWTDAETQRYLKGLDMNFPDGALEAWKEKQDKIDSAFDTIDWSDYAKERKLSFFVPTDLSSYIANDQNVRYDEENDVHSFFVVLKDDVYKQLKKFNFNGRPRWIDSELEWHYFSSWAKGVKTIVPVFLNSETGDTHIEKIVELEKMLARCNGHEIKIANYMKRVVKEYGLQNI